MVFFNFFKYDITLRNIAVNTYIKKLKFIYPVINTMDITKLRGKFLMMRLWAHRYHIADFPKKLSSLETDNYTPQMIQNDFKKLQSYYKHPAYLAFFGGYEQIQRMNCSFKE